MRKKVDESAIDSYREKDEEYQNLIDRINMAYGSDPLLTKDALKEMVSNTEREIKYGKPREDDMILDEAGKPIMDKYDLYKNITMFIFIAALGLLNISNIGMYAFGTVFFIAGYCVGFSVPMAGVIFLFSHGITGLCIMTVSTIGKIFENPIMQDNPQNIYIYLGACILIALFATLTTVKKNLKLFSPGKEPKISTITGMYMVYFILIALLPKLLPFIYNL